MRGRTVKKDGERVMLCALFALKQRRTVFVIPICNIRSGRSPIYPPPAAPRGSLLGHSARLPRIKKERRSPHADI